MELNERMAAVETRLNDQGFRLDKHDDQLDNLRTNDARLEAKLDGVCHEVKETKREVAENTELTRTIKDGVKTIKWMFYAAAGALSIWLTIKQLGWL